jgi:hypothetical protein
MIFTINQSDIGSMRPAFTLCSDTFSSDPALQNQRWPKVNTPTQQRFLERFLDGQWHTVANSDESRFIDSVLFDLGWRFNCQSARSNPAACSEYKLVQWQIQIIKHLSRRFMEASV